jgi:hypothetical protein
MWNSFYIAAQSFNTNTGESDTAITAAGSLGSLLFVLKVELTA